MRPIVTGWMCRKSAEPGGIVARFRGAAGMEVEVIPREVAGWNLLAGGGGRVPVTWAEIHARRAEEQRIRLENIRRCDGPAVRPAQVWCFLVPEFPFMGWWCYLRTTSGYIGAGRAVKGNVSRDSDLALDLMRRFPLGILPAKENFDAWMEAFAERYPRKSAHDPRKSGILTGWTDGRGFFLTKAEAMGLRADGKPCSLFDLHRAKLAQRGKERAA